MPMPELRQDPITGRWVIVAADRSARPHDFDVALRRCAETACPFCEGREAETPHEVFALREPGSPPNGPGWRVRVVPNKFPAVLPHAQHSVGQEPLCRAADGLGVHEVIIESPRHLASPAQLSAAQWAEAIEVYRTRLAALRHDARLKYALVFKNVGAAAGASLEHTHSQLLALPIIPDVVQQELDGAAAFYRAHGQCPFCAVIENERSAGPRLVLESPHFVALCPYASRFGYETWLLPRQHAGRFEDLPPAMVDDLAVALRSVLAAIERSTDPPAYNLLFHTLPFDSAETRHYHWHVEILPSLTRTAGFEWGTGIHINPVPPEEAAQRLRRQIGRQQQ